MIGLRFVTNPSPLTIYPLSFILDPFVDFAMSKTFYTVFLVGVGGFAGSVARYLLGGWVQQLSGRLNFPYGTIAVNLAGCFVIGLLSYLVDAREMFSTEARAFLFVGVLGGFTTFSAFGNETMVLLRHGYFLYAMLNVVVQVAAGLFLVWAGREIAQLIRG